MQTTNLSCRKVVDNDSVASGNVEKESCHAEKYQATTVLQARNLSCRKVAGNDSVASDKVKFISDFFARPFFFGV